MKLVDATRFMALFALAAPACSPDRAVAHNESDKEVSLAEYQEGQSARFKRLDHDGDGVLEYGTLPMKVGKRIGRMDTDGDGYVTINEFEHGLKRAFVKADVNHDGSLQPYEQH